MKKLLLAEAELENYLLVSSYLSFLHSLPTIMAKLSFILVLAKAQQLSAGDLDFKQACKKLIS